MRPQGPRRDRPPVDVRDVAARARAALLLLGPVFFLASVLRGRFRRRRRRGQALAAPQRRELHRRRHERERRHNYTTHEHAPHLVVGRVGAQPDAVLARALRASSCFDSGAPASSALAAFFCCAWNLSNSSRSSDFISMRVGSRRSIAVISETAAAAKRLDCGGLLLAAEDACTRTAPFLAFAAPAAR